MVLKRFNTKSKSRIKRTVGYQRLALHYGSGAATSAGCYNSNGGLEKANERRKVFSGSDREGFQDNRREGIRIQTAVRSRHRKALTGTMHVFLGRLRIPALVAPVASLSRRARPILA